jgi:uncharacterized RDD family membrane protein YckC
MRTLSTQRKYLPEVESGDWKQELNERLAAHRTRRGHGSVQLAVEQSLLPGLEIEPSETARRIADKVAARYANAPSYSELLAGEARAAARAADRAVSAAQEAAAAAQAFLQGLDLGPEEQIAPARTRSTDKHSADVRKARPRTEIPYLPLNPSIGPLTVRALPEPPVAPSRMSLNITEETESFHTSDPFVEATVDAAEPIPANLIEFPRQIVATRRAQPGPEYTSSALTNAAYSSQSQSTVLDKEQELRIFEVDENHAAESFVPAYVEPLPAADYPATVYVDQSPSRAQYDPFADPLPAKAVSAQTTATLFPAPLPQRSMAILLDLCVVGFAFLSFYAVAGLCTTHLPGGKFGLGLAGVLFTAIALLYHGLFLTFAEATPGMMYAQVGLCSFDDENLTRSQRQRRILATVMAAIPLGLGLLWALFDEDRLGWQDRMSRSYQRSYAEY